MKSKLFSSIKVSLIINFVLFLINLISAYFLHVLPFSMEIPGGDCIEHIGFGVELIEIFTLSITGTSGGTTYDVKINIISLIVSIIFICFIVLIIKLITEKSKNK